MNKKSKILFGAIGLILLSLVIWAVGSVPKPPAEKEAAPRIMKYENNVLSEEQDGRKIWEITAEKINVDADTQNVDMENITGAFYQEDGKTATLTAPHGYYESQSRNIKLDGGIEVETSDGAKLSSAELDWLAADSILAAEGEAKIKTQDMEATGAKIESKDAFQEFKITGGAHIVKGTGKS